MKDIQNILYEHKFNIKKLENTRLEIERIKAEYQGISGLAFDGEGGGGTNAISRRVENEVMKKIEHVEKLQATVRLLEIRIEQVNNALEMLDEIEKHIIILRYNNNMDMYDIAEEVGYAYRTCTKYHKAALEKIKETMPK